MSLQEKLEIPVTLNYASGLCNQTHMLNSTNKPKLLDPPPPPPPAAKFDKHSWDQKCSKLLRTECYLFQLLGVGPDPRSLPLPPSPAVSLRLAAHLLLNQPSSTAAKQQKTCADLQQKKSLFCLLSTRQEHNCTKKHRRLQCANFQLSYMVRTNS